MLAVPSAAKAKLKLAAAYREVELRGERQLQSDLGERGRAGGLMRFVQYFWHVLEPNTPLVLGMPMEAICLHLEAVSRGEIKRLLINVSPGSAKSLLVNVFWPAWEWSAAGMPWLRYITFAYAAYLTERDNQRFRDIIKSPEFQELWGHVFRLTSDGQIKPSNDAKGWKFSSSMRGVGTGERGHRILADDLHNIKEGESEAVRTETVRWVQEGMSNRLNDMLDGVIIMIGQRVHEEDVSNAMISKDLGYVHLCYDAETEVLTRNGWTRFDNLAHGADVLAVDPQTLNAQWETPTHYTRLAYDGYLMHYKSAVLDLAVTPDHRMVFKDYNDWKTNKTTNWRVKAAKDLPRHFYVPQAVQWAGTVNTPDHTIEYGGRRWQADNFADFMGWYLAEGCADGARASTRIVQSDGPYADEIEEVLRRSPFSFTRTMHGRPGMSIFYVGSKELATTLAALGTSHTKYVPAEVAQLPAPLLRRFITAFAKGDGGPAGRYGNGVLMSSRSKQLIDGIQECCIKAGWAATVHRREIAEHKFNGYTLPGGTVWTLYIRYSKAATHNHKWYAKVKASNVQLLPYSGDVFCVSVPSTALVVRRNGRVAISGNCIPNEYDPARHCATDWWEDPRSELNELAWPERFPPEVVRLIKLQLGPFAYTAQYQQAPEPRGGGILKRDWWRQYELPIGAPPQHDITFTVASLDPAFTAHQENDPSGFTVWGVYYDKGDPHILCLQAWKKWLELHGTPIEKKPNEDLPSYMRRAAPHWGLVEWVLHECKRLHVNVLLIENKGGGHFVAQELQRLYGNHGFDVLLIDPGTADKRARAYAIQHLLSAGMVECPADKGGYFRDWAQMLIDECAKFRGLPGDEDNLVDSTTQALKYLRDISLAVRREEREFMERELSRYRPPSKPLYPV